MITLSVSVSLMMLIHHPDMNIPNDIPVLENIVLTPDEVKDTLQSLKSGKASGSNGINNRVLKELAFELASPLCT